MKRRQLRGYDLKQIGDFTSLIGVDEVGRGALAGPVVAAAVSVTKAFLEGRWAMTRAQKVNDSKQLTALDREELFQEFKLLEAQGLIVTSLGMSSVEEIEVLNILGATKLAMRRALEAIHPPSAFERRTEPDLFASAVEVAEFAPRVSCHILIDGLPLKHFAYPHVGVVRGDGRSLCIAMASIVAKVTRDQLMVELDAKSPLYGFAQHKGYGTEEHRLAVLQHGAISHHRTVFLRKLLSQRNDAAQLNFLRDD